MTPILRLRILISVGMATLVVSSPQVGAQDQADTSASNPRVASVSLKLVRDDYARASAANWSKITEARPSLVGFRAITDPTLPIWPYFLPGHGDSPELQSAADIVTQRLARDGLLSTMVQVITTIGPEKFGSGEQEDLELLKRTGLPVDWLQCFQVEGADQAGTAYSAIRYFSSLISSGRSAAEIGDAIRRSKFVFRKCSPEFRASSESGLYEIDLFRLQLARGDYWRGKGDGSSLDIACQLAAAAPNARFLLTAEEDQCRILSGFVRQWPLKRLDHVTIVSEPFEVSEWAQDNGKPGIIKSSDGATNSPATLTPRYASRGEEGSILVPGECRLWAGLRAAGHVVNQSPLLFQGGNVMLVEEPGSGNRRLLVGEAEIWRNVALGLSAAQVIEAFRIEFDASDVVVLPAASYHIDYEVSIRAVNGGLTAFVNDTVAASRIILKIGLNPLQRAGLLTEAQVNVCQRHLQDGQIRDYLAIVRSVLASAAVRPGQYPESLADHFSAGLVDSGVGNFQSYLLALDLATFETLAAGESTQDRDLDEYVAAIRRRNEARQQLWNTLKESGFAIAPIPSLAEENRGLNHLNGIHANGRYFMPGSGGLFESYDRLAAEAFSASIGPSASIVTIHCGESQRRYGALHCAVSAYSVEKGPVPSISNQ